ncbi:Eco57I restriction-modification methylase domain-containing protein [Mariniflexile aquimaris]|uniref:site-specific DNA-methyltransferase (adenine-specific) n=1 Tax=Mariniflexile aquimaris TaxID=881009 RepID=A0ABW3BQH7_9FLAO
MAFFQNSVLYKHLKGQDEKTVKVAYQKFVAYFHNPAIQQNIRDAKEEQFQEGFLRELFVDILGYTLNPQPEFNLTTELKNEKGAKKADGAILHNGKALGVIELKGTDTKDLDKINVQAFNYKNNQTGCVYVITSNFEKLRFFIHHSVEHLEFNLFTLSETEFQLLWLCLSVENLLNGVPLKVKEESLHEEEKITKQLYKDYAAFRNDLWQNMVKNNAVADKLVLFKKTQKLLDRFLFILFAEDSGLLPPNSISRILKRWEVLKAEDAYKPLYDIFKQYFGYIDTGRKGQKTVDDIFAYNGGLFLPDALLDTILLDDEILHSHVLKLTKYDFQSEVDVNILGHIFENSLNEIESITAQLEGQEIDKSKTKRKKDGVFYTPKYITKYIVDNTVGKLCDEKKEALGIVDEEYAKGRKNRKKDIVKGLDVNLQAYRNWLLNITICDPACGSGAFLNQALEFLMEEHTYIDELESQLLGHAFEFPGVENHILEKNIFGVDINEESVDIAKLSLWLRTAQRGRKLTSLNNNLKCGNSLIDDPIVAGEKAFNWQKEFPAVFEKGGFDVVIGNPPYLRIQGLKDAYPELVFYYENHFKAATGNYDIYTLFLEKAYKLLNKIGIVTFILPHKFLIADFGKGIRGFLLERNAIEELVHFGSQLVFQDATTYTCIISLSYKHKSSFGYKQIEPVQLFNHIPFNEIQLNDLSDDQWILTDKGIGKVLSRISKQPKQLKDVFDRFAQGIITGKDAVFCVTGRFKGIYLEVELETGEKYTIEKAVLKPHLRGEDISKYRKLVNNEWLIFPYKLDSGKAELFDPNEMLENFPKAMEYLKKFENQLREREKGKFDNDYWYQYSRNQAISVLEQPKIITPEVCFGGSMTLDLTNFYHNSKCHTLLLNIDSGYKLKSILPFLNSKLFWFYLSNTGNVLRGGYIGVKRRVLELFPIPYAKSVDQNLMRNFTDEILKSVSHLQDVESNFINLLRAKFEIEKLTTKLKNWHELEFKDFLKELKKVKVQLSLSEESEWMQYFNEQKQKALELKSEINKIDSEIDQMVYKLYGLTDEEVKIIETSIY